MKQKLIELWKDNCEHCEEVKPIVKDLGSEGYVFEKHSIEEKDGEALWHEYVKEIEKNNKSMGYDEGYIYTPTFINPKTRKLISFQDRAPKKEELMQLAEESAEVWDIEDRRGGARHTGERGGH